MSAIKFFTEMQTKLQARLTEIDAKIAMLEKSNISDLIHNDTDLIFDENTRLVNHLNKIRAEIYNKM